MEDMDVLWSKEKLQKIFSKDSIPLTGGHASGDGCSSLHCCRLCGGCNNLRCFCDTYVWDGVQERYDQLLYDCFGIRALHTDGRICECCVRQLRNTQRFRALVIAAFAKAPSENVSKITVSTNHSKMGIGEGYTHKGKNRNKMSNVELLKKTTRTTIDNIKKRRQRKSIFNSNVQTKRMNIACSMCKQRYPMIVPFDGWKSFVCSRCKKNTAPRTSICRKRNNIIVPTSIMQEHLDKHAKVDLRNKSRLLSIPKQSSQLSRNTSTTNESKYKLYQRPKRFPSQNLTKHISRPENVLDYKCDVCDKDMKTRDLLDKHMRTHTGQPMYQCDVCMRVFKGKTAFQIHYLTHGK